MENLRVRYLTYAVFVLDLWLALELGRVAGSPREENREGFMPAYNDNCG
jgi:hypothetical protein